MSARCRSGGSASSVEDYAVFQLSNAVDLEHNAVAGNPVDGVKRPMSNNTEGSTPALCDAQARKLLDAPQNKESQNRESRDKESRA